MKDNKMNYSSQTISDIDSKSKVNIDNQKDSVIRKSQKVN